MPDTRMASWTHEDAQGDRMVIACYADIGVGPAVVFDGGAFTDAAALRAFIADLDAATGWLREENA